MWAINKRRCMDGRPIDGDGWLAAQVVIYCRHRACQASVNWPTYRSSNWPTVRVSWRQMFVDSCVIAYRAVLYSTSCVWRHCDVISHLSTQPSMWHWFWELLFSLGLLANSYIQLVKPTTPMFLFSLFSCFVLQLYIFSNWRPLYFRHVFSQSTLISVNRNCWNFSAWCELRASRNAAMVISRKCFLKQWGAKIHFANFRANQQYI